MIRRTVAKAFGSGEERKAPVASALRETGRGAAVERLFHDLYDALEAGVAERAAPTGPADGTAPADAAAPAEGLPNQPPRGLPNQPPRGLPNQPPRGLPNQPPRGLPNQPPRGPPTNCPETPINHPGGGLTPAENGEPILRLTKPRTLAGGIEFYLEGPGALLRFLHPLRGFVQVSLQRGGAASRELLFVQLQGGSYRPAQKSLPRGLGQALFSSRPTTFRYSSVPELARHYMAQASGEG